MKKIFLGLAVVLGTLAFAQYGNNGWGNGNNNSGYYGNDNSYTDNYYFPEDYYYDYPTDYYADNYYQSYYNDYRNSIVMVNWNDFFRSSRLSRGQIQQIMMLNEMYASFSNWNSYYRHNPDRWYYDRFYTLQQILGPQVFIVFKNNYYNGYNPVVYFQNYRRDYYAPRYRVQPHYARVNTNTYRVDRNRFLETHGNKYGWSQTKNPHTTGFRDTNSSGVQQGNGFRNESVKNTEVRSTTNSGGFRNPSTATTTSNNGGFRNSSTGNVSARPVTNSGIRPATPRSSQTTAAPSTSSGMRSSSSSSGMRSGSTAAPQQNSTQNTGKRGGFR